jgi:hypothetical protein
VAGTAQHWEETEPFIVIDYKQKMFYNWRNFLEKLYSKKCPFTQRAVSQ